MAHGVVEVDGGRISGVERDGVWSFSGVPYAGAPVGRGRWRPPGPVTPWRGVRACDRFGPVAPQNQGGMEQALGGVPEPTDEDCLTLNVWTPGLDGARRPVLVWIHGGSFQSGSGSGALTRGGHLAREGDVVVVTVNYRLGLLGFLAHPALGDDGQAWLGDREWTGWGSWGLADQVAALAWVRDHIGDLGGDPANVTLFGESAGGMSVASLLGAPAAAGLFHRAVGESGPPYTCSAEAAAERAERLADHLGVACTRAALEQVPVDALVAAAQEYVPDGHGGASAGLLLTPVVDGGLLPAPPAEAVAAGSASGVDLLIGTTRDEAAFFALGNPALTSLDHDGLVRWVERLGAGPEAAAAAVGAVSAARAARGETTDPLALWTAIATESIFRVGSVRLADAHAAAARPGTGTFTYLFTWASPAFGGILGSCHALEIPFVFGSLRHPVVQAFSGGGDDAFALSDAMGRAWASFARTGVPSCPPGGAWPAWDAARRPTTVLGPWDGRPGPVHAVDDPRSAELDAVAALLPTGSGHRVR
jgi:para-nitrobenzyl esterase